VFFFFHCVWWALQGKSGLGGKGKRKGYIFRLDVCCISFSSLVLHFESAVKGEKKKGGRFLDDIVCKSALGERGGEGRKKDL